MSTDIRSFFLKQLQQQKPEATPSPSPQIDIRSFFLQQLRDQEPEDATLMDAYSAFAQGGIGSLKSLTDLAPGFLGGAANPLSSALGDASEYWQGQVSPGRRAELERQEQEKAALGEDAPVLDRMGLYVSQLARNPVTTIAEGIGNMVPLAGVGRAARVVGMGAKAASALMGTASGGGSVIGNIYDTTYRSLIKQGVPEEEARARAVEAASYTSAPAEIALGAGMGYVSSRVGADKEIARMVGVEESVAAMRKAAKDLSVRGVGKGALKETGSEFLEEYEQNRLGNLGAIRAGAQIDPNQGALEAGTKGAVIGMVPGGLGTAASGYSARQGVKAYDQMQADLALVRAAEQPGGLRTGPMPGLDATVPAGPAQGQQGAAEAPSRPISGRDLPEVNRDVYDALIAQGVPEPDAIARAWNAPPSAATTPPQGAQPPLQGQPPAAAPAPPQAAPAPPQGPPAQPQGDPGAGLSPFAPFARQYDAPTAEAIERLGIEPPAPVSYLSGALPVAIAEAGAESQLVGGSRLRTLRARFEDAFDKVVSGLTERSDGRPADIPGDTDPVSVGARIKQHADEFLRKFQRVKEDLYDAATIPREGLPIDVQETKQFLRTVIEEKTAANALDRRAFVGILEALERIPENEDPDAPAPTAAEAYVVRAVIKDLNGRVGAMAGDPNKSGDPVALLKIREMLSQALDSGLAQLDPALGRDLEMANRYYAHAKDNIGLALGQRYSRLVETPEKLVSALLNPGTSLAQLGPLREVLGDETVDDMAAVAVASMIRDSTDPLTGRLTPRGLSKALQRWGGDTGVLSELLSDEQLQKLKDVARVALASERSAKITGGSKTAFLQGLAGGGLVALIANPGLLMGVAAGVVSARASARLMATEGFRTWLTKGFGGRAAFKSGMRTSNRLIDPARVAAAKARLAAEARKLGRGTPNGRLIPVSPQMLADATIVGADILDSGVRDLAQWSKRMIQDVGAWVKPHLSDLFSKAKEMRKVIRKGSVDVGRVNVREGTQSSGTVDLDSILESPSHTESARKTISKYDMMADVADLPAAELFEVFIERASQHLQKLWHLMPADQRARAVKWYEGFNRISKELADKYDMTHGQANALVAVFSPQKDWFQNVSLAHRTAKIAFEHADAKWTTAMSENVEAYISSAEDAKEHHDRVYLREIAKRLEGKPLYSLDNEDAAVFIRFFDETYHDRSFNMVTPEGGFLGPVRGKPEKKNPQGKELPVAWPDFNRIEMAVSIMRDGSPENISKALGKEHKVRSFHNAGIDPFSFARDVVVDTHATGASLMRAYSGNDLPVAQTFGMGGTGGRATGARGTYGLHVDAYRRAAAAVGLKTANPMQSVTWEVIRDLVPRELKKKMRPLIDAVWFEYRKGKITLVEASTKVLDVVAKVRGNGNEILTPHLKLGPGLGIAQGGSSFDQSVRERPRVVTPTDWKETIRVNASVFHASVPEFAAMQKLAEAGDKDAIKQMQDFAGDHLKALFRGLPVEITIDRTIGSYGSVEPSVVATFEYPHSMRAQVLSGLEIAQDTSRQDAYHVLEPAYKLPDGTKPKFGHEYGDGSFATRVFSFHLKRKLTPEVILEIQKEAGAAAFDEIFKQNYKGKKKGPEYEAKLAEWRERTAKEQGVGFNISGRKLEMYYDPRWSAHPDYAGISPESLNAFTAKANAVGDSLVRREALVKISSENARFRDLHRGDRAGGSPWTGRGVEDPRHPGAEKRALEHRSKASKFLASKASESSALHRGETK